MQYKKVAYSNTQLKNASDRVRKSKEKQINIDDLNIINSFRQDHMVALDTFRKILDKRALKFNKTKDVVFVSQRSKTLKTILDKLRNRPRKDPRHSPQIGRMQDIVGCRVICNDLKTLESFRLSIISQKTNHIRKSKEHHDYITFPKCTGYRGIHEVYKYQSKNESYLNGKNIYVEIQLRTKIQHYWATAVELVDLLKGTRIKFARGDEKNQYVLYFKYASEILARYYEGGTSCFPDKSIEEVIFEFESLESDLKILKDLKKTKVLKDLNNISNLKKYAILRLSKKKHLYILTDDNEDEMTKKCFMLEQEYPDDIIVFVTGLSKNNIKESFKNYYKDGYAFIAKVEEAIANLKEKEGIEIHDSSFSKNWSNLFKGFTKRSSASSIVHLDI